MKNQFFAACIAIVVLLQLSVLKGNAQSRLACISKDGYWVLISNVHIKKVTTVQFYNNDHQLIYEEVVRHQKMDLNRLKTLRCLKKGLDSALIAWNHQKKTTFDRKWIAVNFKH